MRSLRDIDPVRARILRIHSNGETSSLKGVFASKRDLLERARNEIEFQKRGDGIVATVVLDTEPLAHYEAVIEDCPICGKPSDSHLPTCTRTRLRFKAEKAIGFKERVL